MREASAEHVGDWLANVSLEQATVWQPHPIEPLALGRFVLNASHYASEEIDYEGLERLLFLVLDEGREDYGRRWFSVAPADTDIENASSTDLLLGAEETSLGVPLRILFSLQTRLVREQLDEQVGALNEEGIQIIERAFSGELDELRFGLPLSGPDDERLAVDHDTEVIVRLLRTPFFETAFDKARESDLEEKDAGQSESSGVVFYFDMQRVRETSQRYALAAQSNLENYVIFATLRSQLGNISGRLHYELKPDMLLFSINEVEGYSSSELVLVVETKSSEHFESPAFVPREGEDIEIAPVYEAKVGKLGLKVRSR
jgi:hypothetical protein